MSAGEWKSMQMPRGEPTLSLGIVSAAATRTSKDIQCNSISRNRVFNRLDRLERFRTKPQNPVRDFLNVGLAVHFEIREFP